MLLVLLASCIAVQAAVCAPALIGAGCATCTGENDGQTCLTCNPQENKVQPGGKKCGVGCPANSTPKESVCECNGGYRPNAQGQCEPSNTNKSSGLSTGAIAGIAVAAVIVVGGLVGFLCWWFICRGKA
ncbi:VSP [Giardia duodenalis]|uniref:VSP n=1 Tax=Giardia intestinalis (strain ATCC 50803 / WB clone C6) TaxID=184922 RepID=A8BT57_GIAIC|nr:VSP [Giardia intestinalis]KAE8302826.1 VSP [Giardia intestinalis]|eukprot:XP_001704930.1 VSP [Giardia lamblia ATCC 50803]